MLDGGGLRFVELGLLLLALAPALDDGVEDRGRPEQTSMRIVKPSKRRPEEMIQMTSASQRMVMTTICVGVRGRR